MKFDYDIAIIGAGSGGLVVASAAANMGAKVLLVENRLMGGDCLNYGCVPSKTFLKSSHLARIIKKSDKYGLNVHNYDISLSKVMDRVQSIIDEIAPHDSVERFESLGVDVKIGHGKIVEKNKIKVDENFYTSKKIVVSTGSTAYIPPIKGLDKVKYYTNESIFELRELPKRLIVLGAGPIGLELGQGFSDLGSDVTIVDRSPTVFSKDEPEVAPIMQKVFEDGGINMQLNSKIAQVYEEDGDIKILLEIGEKEQTISGDVLLVALGRQANTSGIGLEHVGVELNQRKNIIVNEKMQTTVENIYACGDVVGSYQFTHAASYQASILVKNALIAPIFKTNYYNMAWTTYTSPEVAHVGLSEKQAIERNMLPKVYTLPISDNDRAKAEDDREGFIKVITDKKGVVIGATIVGEKAGEMLAFLSLMVTKKIKLSSAMGVIFQYPIQSEIIKSLALVRFKSSAKPWQRALLKKIVKR